MMSVLISALATLKGLIRSRVALHLEVLALRHQVQIVQRSRPRRLRLAKVDRYLWAWLARAWGDWRTAVVIVKPETVIAWSAKASACSGHGRVADATADRPSSLILAP
jgi:putative transposase